MPEVKYRPRQIDQLQIKGQQKFSYVRVPKDKNGWVDAIKFWPANFDLVYLDDGTNIYNGWCTGSGFDGYKLPEGTKIKKWKRRCEDRER